MKQMILPIVVPNCFNWYTLLSSLSAAILSDIIEARSLDIPVLLKTYFHIPLRTLGLQGGLAEQKHPFHTFVLPQECELKVVITGIPHSIDSSFIKEELKNVGFTPISPVNHQILCTSLYLPGEMKGLPYPNIYTLQRLMRIGHF